MIRNDIVQYSLLIYIHIYIVCTTTIFHCKYCVITSHRLGSPINVIRPFNDVFCILSFLFFIIYPVLRIAYLLLSRIRERNNERFWARCCATLYYITIKFTAMVWETVCIGIKMPVSKFKRLNFS